MSICSLEFCGGILVSRSNLAPSTVSTCLKFCWYRADASSHAAAGSHREMAHRLHEQASLLGLANLQGGGKHPIPARMLSP
eukprot:scaffold85613_cov43-Prasinocladus_malaysianus.AAC.1